MVMGGPLKLTHHGQAFGPAPVNIRKKTGRAVMAAGKPGPLSGLDLKGDQEAVLHQRMKKPGAVSRPGTRSEFLFPK
jgi:hypothetical protein